MNLKVVTTPIKAWYIANSLSLKNGDGRRIKVGRTHSVEGPVLFM